jgi:Fe-S cluster assembly protein SufD
MQGLSLLSGKAQSFIHATAGHDAARGTSRQCFKNILSGQTQSEFNSMVRVSPAGVKTDSQQLSRTLLLSEGAVAHARPQLQIDIDDVVCAHGATVGQLQAQELFYLRTRGLSEKTARYMLTYGFAKEMLGVLELPALHAMLKDRMQSKLGKMVAA